MAGSLIASRMAWQSVVALSESRRSCTSSFAASWPRLLGGPPVVASMPFFFFSLSFFLASKSAVHAFCLLVGACTVSYIQHNPPGQACTVCCAGMGSHFWFLISLVQRLRRRQSQRRAWGPSSPSSLFLCSACNWLYLYCTACSSGGNDRLP